MFQYFNNILTVQSSFLFNEAALMTFVNYQNLTKRGQLNVIRRGCKGTPALVEYSSIPERFRQTIEEKYGDPRLTTKHNRFIDQLELDTRANEFFNNYTLDNGYPLPEKSKQEYIANAVVLNAIQKLVNQRSSRVHALGGKATKIWDNLAVIIQELPKHTYPHTLPKNVRRLKDKYFQYKNEGYQALIHKGYCNTNSEKITDAAKPWLLSRWADRVNRCATYQQLLGEYNKLAEENGWKLLKNADTLKLYLNQEELVHLWYGNRMGEKVSKEKFTYHFSTKLPTLRDSLWYSDGTKLNFFYLNGKGEVETCMVYEVMDAFSEVFLGFHVSASENYEAQYGAYKMAIQFAGHRPYEIRFDNQGGHKKLETGNFLSNLAKFTIKTQPYNGKSKTIESAFGRFQQQYLARYWFFTGQNITAKKQNSKANLEFFGANKKNLPSLNEVIEAYVECRNAWNNAKHPTHNMSRLELYQSSENPACPKVELFDMVNLFWIERPKPVMMTAYGLSFQEKGAKYTYMVHDETRLPNIDWLKKNIDKKFIVKFDPDDMDLVMLYEQTPLGLRFVTEATTKVEYHRNIQEQQEGERSDMQKIIERNKKSRISSQDQIDTLQEVYNMLPEQYGLNSPKIAGVKNPNKIKNKSTKAAKKSAVDLDKELSNVVRFDDDQYDVNYATRM